MCMTSCPPIFGWLVEMMCRDMMQTSSLVPRKSGPVYLLPPSVRSVPAHMGRLDKDAGIHPSNPSLSRLKGVKKEGSAAAQRM